MKATVTRFPVTRQGIRDLDQISEFLPISGGPVPSTQAVNVSEKERAASTVLGAGLIGVFLARPSRMSLIGGLIGGAMLYRGLSGHCELNRLLGRSSADPKHAKDELAYRAG